MPKKLTEEQKAKNRENGKLGGCPPKYETANDFSAKVDEFIRQCESGEIEEPTDYEIVKFFGVSPRTLDRYRADYKADDNDSEDSTEDIKSKNNTYKGFGEALKKIDLYREHATILEVKHEPRLAGHAAFKLKQPHWGGWDDKQRVEASGSVKVEFNIAMPK